MKTTSISSTRFLDEGMINLQSTQNFEDVAETVAMIFSELHRIRHSFSTEAWKQFATVDCRQYPLIEFLHQDPLSLRAFTKPRGYPGDAVMLDFILSAHYQQRRQSCARWRRPCQVSRWKVYTSSWKRITTSPSWRLSAKRKRG